VRVLFEGRSEGRDHIVLATLLALQLLAVDSAALGLVGVLGKTVLCYSSSPLCHVMSKIISRWKIKHKPISSLLVMPNLVEVTAIAVMACGKTNALSRVLKLMVSFENDERSELGTY